MNFENFFLEKWYDSRGTKDWTVNLAYDSTKITDEYDNEIGKVVNDEYEYITVLPDNMLLEVRVVGSHYDDYEQDGEMDDMNSFFNVFIETFYGSNPRKQYKDITYSSSGEDRRDTLQKSQPYSTYVQYHKDLVEKRKKEREEMVKNLEAQGKEVPEYLKTPDYHAIPIAPYSHAKVANRIISLVTGLLKEITKDYDILVIDFETKQHEEKMKSLVDKIAKNMGAAPTKIYGDAERIMKNRMDWISSNAYLAYDLPRFRSQQNAKDLALPSLKDIEDIKYF
jgi:predicted CoA-binding protein